MESTSNVNPLQRAQEELTRTDAARVAAYAVKLDGLKAQCGEQMQCIDLILAWVRHHNLGREYGGLRVFDMAEMNIPDENGRIDLLTKYTLRFDLERGSMRWNYVSGTASSCGWHQLLDRESGFWTVMVRVSADAFLGSLRETAKREQVPMPV
jgi:hypothetical protein